MRFRIILKISIVSSIILLCTGVAISLYLKMSIKERAEYFNLFTLVPPDTKMVVDTDNMIDLIQQINDLSCSKDHQFLYFSHFFAYFKDHVNGLLDQSPHSLNKQMGKMLISFHQPEGEHSQVFYFRLGAGDDLFIEKFIQKYSERAFPSRTFDYRGEEIRIYPMPDDLFLACFVHRDFFVLSYRKKLIEEVIDTYLSEQSILDDERFLNICSEHRMTAAATIYAKLQSIEMGNGNDTIRMYSDIGDWTEFNLNLNQDAIYLTGVNYDTDSVHTFMNAIRKQEPIIDFYDNAFPESAFLLSKFSISNPWEAWEYTPRGGDEETDKYNFATESDKDLIKLLKKQIDAPITICMFHANDTVAKAPYAIASMPLNLHLSDIAQVLETFRYSISLSNRFFILPPNTQFARLTGITDPSANTYLYLRNKRLLIAPDVESIEAYLDFIDKDLTLPDENEAYESLTTSLQRSYNYMMMADMDRVLELSGCYARTIPNLFFRYRSFFRHFILTVQLTCDADGVYPNLVLTYKGEQAMTAYQQ